MGPGTAGLAATQLNVFVNTWLATGQGTGAVSWLNYAFRLMYLPIGLFGVSIATAVLPTVSRQSAQQDETGVRNTVANGMSLMMMLNVPSTVGLVVLATPIVQLIFERGRFTAADTLATASALRFYAIGLLGYSVVRIASPTFYALGQNRIPVQVGAATVVINAALTIALVRVLGYRGLALGTSLAALFNAGVLLYLLRRRLGGINGGHLAASLARISLASVVMGAAAAATSHQLGAWLPGPTLIAQVARLAATIGIAVAVLSAAAHLLRIREFRDGVALVTSRFHRRPI
jgi:putative peptidoglycan lipid II flippase